MHELSLAHSILSIAENAVSGNPGARITGVGLQVGELSSIEIESLEFAFSVIKSGSILENAALHIDIVKGEAECMDCKNIFPISSFATCCPTCNCYSVKILRGREMRVLHLEMEED
jgi:hydrogenase nickel incorporation protein HypA/HybF